MTTPGKNAPGLTGFPTPDETPDDDAYLVFYFPNDPAWGQLILGAVQALIYEFNWYQWGALTPAQAAEAFRIITQQAPYNLLPAKLPTPFWDESTGDDADDEQPIETQPWYGEIQVAAAFVVGDEELTFIEDAFIWVVAGLIAYSGQVGAAIAFVPIARKFVITVKSNPLGGIIQFLQDAVEIGRVDTYSASDVATSANVVMEDGGSPTLWIRLLPDNPHDLESVSATVMRSRLSEDDFSNPSQRYNVDCDCIQVTPDGGTTWNDSPGSDPRHNPAWLKPPVAGSNKQCDAAANMVKWVRDFIEEVTALLEVGAIITTIANKALEFFDLLIPEADFITLIIAIAGTIFGIGAGALETGFTDETYDLLLCIFYCSISSDGSVTAEQLSIIQGLVTVRLNETASIVMTLIFQAQGEIGLSNAGAIGSETGDCSGCDCGWCYEWNFVATNGGFTATVSGSLTEGTYHAGSGWQETIQNDACTAHGYLSVYTDVSSGNLGNLDTIQIFYLETNHDGSTYFIDQDDSSSSILTRTSWATYTTAGDSFAVVGNASATRLAIIAFPCGQDPAHPATLYKLRAKGMGTMPAFTGGSLC